MKHIFDTEIAKAHGFAAAVIHENICHWVRVNKANGNNLHDGRYWTFNSVKAFGEIFDYLKPWQIRVALDDLVNAGLLLKGCFNKKGYDRTAWYTTSDDSSLADVSHLRSASNGVEAERKSNCGEPQVHLRDITNPFEAGSEPIPDIKPILKPDENTQDACAAHPFDQKVQGIPQPIAERLEEYRKAVQDFGQIGRLMVPINCAIAIVGPQIVHDAIAQVIAEAPSLEPRYRVTNIVKLLGDEQRLRERAAKYQPIQTGPPEWTKSDDPEYKIDRVMSLIKHGIEVPKEAAEWIQQAQERLQNSLAS